MQRKSDASAGIVIDPNFQRSSHLALLARPQLGSILSVSYRQRPVHI